jgi:hypothetical protein
MIQKLPDLRTSRRRFLRDVAVAGGLAAAAAASGASVPEVEAAQRVDAAKPAGYRLTPHVAKYYEKARF